MKKINPLIFSYSLFFLFLFSCSEPQDFNQAKDLEVIPDLSGSIVYVETTEAIINSISPVAITQNINFDAFTSSIFSDKVISGSVKFQLENTTSIWKVRTAGKKLRVKLDFFPMNCMSLADMKVEIFSPDHPYNNTVLYLVTTLGYIYFSPHATFTFYANFVKSTNRKLALKS